MRVSVDVGARLRTRGGHWVGARVGAGLEGVVWAGEVVWRRRVVAVARGRREVGEDLAGHVELA